MHIGTINDIPQEVKKNGQILTFDFTSCSEKFLPLENSRVLIDPKDIISSKNITAILKEPNSRFKIQNREGFLEVYDFAGNKIGALNSVTPYFEQQNYPYHQVRLLPFDITFTNGYFTAKKLGHNYVGCISDENGECRRFYKLNPGYFGYEHDNSPGPYPYYYNLENFGNFLEVDMKTQEYIDLETRIVDLEEKIKLLKQYGVSGIPGIKGEKGEPGIPGREVHAHYASHGYQGQKGEPGSDAKPEDVADILLSKIQRFREVLFNTPVTTLEGKTLVEYIMQDLPKDIVGDEDFRKSIFICKKIMSKLQTN